MRRLKVVVSPLASEQLEALPEAAQRKVAHALRVLAHVPLSGRQLPFTYETYTKLVVLRRGRWTIRIVYRIRGDELRFERTEPGWMPHDLF